MFPQIATVIPTTVDVSSSGILPLKSNAQKDEDADMDDNEEEAIRDGPNIPGEWAQPRAFVYSYLPPRCVLSIHRTASSLFQFIRRRSFRIMNSFSAEEEAHLAVESKINWCVTMNADVYEYSKRNTETVPCRPGPLSGHAQRI